MIRLADPISKAQVWDMWKRCFGDPDDYMELYFRYKYRPEDTLLYIEGSEAVASLQMLTYQFTFHGVEIPVIYLSGVCTLPAYRSRGYARALLLESFNEAIRRGVPLMLLVPQEEGLMNWYARYGFVRTFDPGSEPLPSLKELLNRHEGDLETAYGEFNRHYREQDMTVQKRFNDFKAIVEEAALFGFPEKKSLPGMARVIDANRLLSLFASRRGDAVLFHIDVRDPFIPRNNLSLLVGEGVHDLAPKLQAEIDHLTRWLLGYRTTELGEPYANLFPEKKPQMHYMLE
jgi:predicted acetyltransferase